MAKKFSKQWFKDKNISVATDFLYHGTNNPNIKILSPRKQKAKGIPDKSYYGSIKKDFNVGDLADFIIQQHDAERAGPHKDWRIGKPSIGLHSWVTRKEFPEPGAILQMFRQPVHSYKYKDFEGYIPSLYGRGNVKKIREEKALITKVNPNELHFTTATKRPNHRLALIQSGVDTKNQQWLLIHPKRIKHPGLGKPKYNVISSKDIDTYISNLKDTDVIQPKVDGAFNFIQFIKNKPEIISHRISSDTGMPIIHTERVFHGRPEALDLPKHFEGSVLLSEIYGMRKGKAIPPQELGGILNASIDKSFDKQKKQNVELKGLLFDVAASGKKVLNIDEVPYSERKKILREIIKYLPKDKFHLPEEAKGSNEAKKLLDVIRSRKHPLTREGIVVHSEKDRPSKAKLLEEDDVYITGIFMGEGKYKNVGAGGFTYSLKKGGPTVGKVGTGISDELRKSMWSNPTQFVGRVARVRSQGSFPKTKALRAPALLALHESK